MRSVLLMVAFGSGVFFLHARAADCVSGCKNMQAWKNNDSGYVLGLRAPVAGNPKQTNPVSQANVTDTTIPSIPVSAVPDGGTSTTQVPNVKYETYQYLNAPTLDCNLTKAQSGKGYLINVTFANPTDWDACELYGGIQAYWRQCQSAEAKQD